jgi:SAM-dependent methyltransferase
MRGEIDSSSGYESFAVEFLERRCIGIGVKEVKEWAKSLPHGCSVIDVGCGPGFPLAEALLAEGLNVFGVDGSPMLVGAFRKNLPNNPVSCEAVQRSKFFDRTFDAVLSWGLVFLLEAEDQRHLIQRFGDILKPGGRLLFTAPARIAVWNDAMTNVESRSLGAEEYRRLLAEAGFVVCREYEDVGENHYYEAVKQ